MLFVFAFLPANLLSQALLKSPRAKNIAMLVFSLVFYSWAGPRYLLLLAGMSLICWAGALIIERADPDGMGPFWLTLTVGLCLAILCIFKYLGFILQNIKDIFGVPELIPAIALPIGISFYTFQLISYVVDVYRGEVEAQRSYWMVLLYASLFHQCIAGPIVRYKDVREDLLWRRTKPTEVSEGVSRFAVGLAKKAVLANGCAAIADQLLLTDAGAMASVPAMGVLLGAVVFTMQIYLDFSAYSDMAIGMGLMCGLHYRENFDYPYLSGSIKEFWRRWHISLGSFFRDYVYIPLGGSRCGELRQLFNLFVVWFLTGLWHGASWNFILWGLYFGLLLAAERFLLGGVQERLPGPVRHGGVLVLVTFSWIIFKFTDMALLGTAVRGLFGLNGNGFTSGAVKLLFTNNVYFLCLAAAACTPLGRMAHTMLRNLGRRNEAFYCVSAVWDVIYPAACLILAAMALVGDSYNPFLYFQF